MTLHLTLSAEEEARLRECAAAAGKDPEAFALQALRSELADDETVSATELPVDAWIARLHRWAAGHRGLPTEADDSRESIYEGRGE